jgi:hypothetical protein
VIEDFVIEAIGWFGAVVYLASYGALALNRLDSNRPLYHVCQIVGAFCYIVNSSAHQAWPSVGLSAAWAVLGVVSLVRLR